MHPVELREMVTSPGGTTIRAIRVLEQSGVRAAFLNAIQAEMERSHELAEGEPEAERRRGPSPAGQRSRTEALRQVRVRRGGLPETTVETRQRRDLGCDRHGTSAVGLRVA